MTAVAVLVSAGPVDREQAQAIAKSFFTSKGKEMTETMPMAKAKSVAGMPGEAAYYIFNASDDNGYVIVSGDDRTPQILGYVDRGAFDETSIPDNMKSWLQYYADQMKWLKDNTATIADSDSAAPAKAVRKASLARHSISPLLKSLWNQFAPYNNQCPIYYNQDGTTGTSATGCVATALAQVINYYKYPDATKAPIPFLTNKYPTDAGDKYVTLRVIPRDTPIDWGNMLDVYTGSETDEQNNAVASLMLMCGQAVKMGYGASSGAGFGDNVADMFRNIFGYDDKVYSASRSKYTSAEWTDLIYSEIANGHPVAYDGFSSGGGHAFVIDGYDGSELFHLNWGWGGSSNGYFLLSVLNPGDNSGAGASSSSDGYSMGQTAIIGVDMPDGITAESRTALTVNDILVSGLKISGNYINWTGNSNTFDCGIVMKDAEGNYVPVGTPVQGVALNINIYKSLSFTLSGAITTPGRYRLSPASKLSSNATWRPHFNMYSEYIEAVVDDSGVLTSLSYHTPSPDLTITQWEYAGSLVSGKQQEVKVTYRNNGDEFYGEIELFASQTSTPVSTKSRGQAVIKAGDTVTLSYYFTPSASGKWNLWLKNGDTTIGSGNVDIIDPSALTPSNLRANTFTISNNAYGNCLLGNIAIQNNASKAYKGVVKVQLWIQGTDGTNTVYGANSSLHDLSLTSGSTGYVPINFRNLIVGRNYFISVSDVAESKNIDNGGIFWGHNWVLKPGVLCWNVIGGISAFEATATTRFGSAYSGAYIDGNSITTVVPSSNANTLYAFAGGVSVPTGLDGYNVVTGDVAKDINISYGSAFYSPVEFTAENAAFSYTFTKVCNGNSGWESITLPIRPTSITIDGQEVVWSHNGSDDDFWLREFYSIDDDGKMVFTDVADLESLRANTPYLIGVSPKHAGKTIVFHGSNTEFKNTGEEKFVVSSDTYRYYGTTLSNRVSNTYLLNDTGDAFVFQETLKAMKPFSTYIITSLPADIRPASIVIGGAVSAGITEINSNTDKDVIYDVLGRRATAPTKGVYIRNGRKYILK